MANSNGQPEATKEPSKLDVLHDQWKKSGAKVAPDSVNKKLVDTYLKAAKTKDEAEEALAAAVKAQSMAVEAIILANGKKHFKIRGRTQIPMSRGDTVFFRGESTGEVQDLG